MIGKLNHIAIATPKLDEAVKTYKNMLGVKISSQRATFNGIAVAETPQSVKMEEGGATKTPIWESDHGRDDGVFQSVVPTRCLWQGLGACMRKAGAL